MQQQKTKNYTYICVYLKTKMKYESKIYVSWQALICLRVQIIYVCIYNINFQN